MELILSATMLLLIVFTTILLAAWSRIVGCVVGTGFGQSLIALEEKRSKIFYLQVIENIDAERRRQNMDLGVTESSFDSMWDMMEGYLRGEVYKDTLAALASTKHTNAKQYLRPLGSIGASRLLD